ncbi:MAG: DinB family protein [Acidobacteria bacterium]|nr:DinB family protein [Acidobacteriota bacterium]
MDFRLEEAMMVLGKTPAVLQAMLPGLPGEWVYTSEEEWTAAGVIGHLIHGEKTDWVPRLRIILAFGESRAFDSFDRTAHVDGMAGKTLEDLLEEFRQLREANLSAVKSMNLSTADLDRRGMHPALGSVRLGEYIAAWTAHDLSHLHQLTRILAKHYGEACGPLRQYLGVLRERNL